MAFELSTDGTTWTALGAGARIAGGWELTGLSLPPAGMIRARARVPGGEFNGSSGLVESMQSYPHIVSDTSWLCSELEQDGWQSLGFDDSTWANAVVRTEYPYPPTAYISGTLGKHIWAAPGSNLTAYCRKTFTVSGTPQPSQAIVRVDDAYDFYLNGALVGYKHTILPPDAQTYDISAYLQTGPNVFAIKGWDLNPIDRAMLFDADVQFNQAPVAKAKNVTVTAGQDCTASASIDNGSYDPDAGDTITLSQSPAGPYAAGDTVVTFTVTDNHGASASSSATVSVLDSTPPAVICPSSQVVNATVTAGATVNYPPVTANDACGPVTVSFSKLTGTIFPIGTTTVSVTATDSTNNQSACDFTVTVKAASEQLADLVTYVNGLPVTQGIKSSLLTKLNIANNALDMNRPAVACVSLRAFIYEAQVLRAIKRLTPAQAGQMITDVTRIRNVIGCT